MPINLDNSSLDKFKKMWNALDESTKEILAGALYILDSSKEKVLLRHHLTKFAMNDDRLNLLSRLVEFTENN